MTEADIQTIREIQDAAQGTARIPASKVKNWIRSQSLDVHGALTGLISDHSTRIEPPLSMKEICDAHLHYYRRCLLENAQSEYVPSRYIAGYELTSWFNGLWKDSSVPREYLSQLKAMLAELYKSGDPSFREAIVNAVLEHLLEDPEMARFFEDWKAEPTLKQAYDLAMEWGTRQPVDPQS
jgi:hypothetical protein